MVNAYLVGAGGGGNIRFPVGYYQHVVTAVFVFESYLGVLVNGVHAYYVSVLLHIHIPARLAGKVCPYSIADTQYQRNQYNKQVVSCFTFHLYLCNTVYGTDFHALSATDTLFIIDS